LETFPQLVETDSLPGMSESERRKPDDEAMQFCLLDSIAAEEA